MLIVIIYCSFTQNIHSFTSTFVTIRQMYAHWHFHELQLREGTFNNAICICININRINGWRYVVSCKIGKATPSRLKVLQYPAKKSRLYQLVYAPCCCESWYICRQLWVQYLDSKKHLASKDGRDCISTSKYPFLFLSLKSFHHRARFLTSWSKQ